MNDQIIALVRTIVPTIVGAIAAFLLTAGIELDEETKTALAVALTGLFAGGYYALVRYIASKLPWTGWLLGHPAVPTYTMPTALVKSSAKSKTTSKAKAKATTKK
jgi:hypothetical protein